MKNRLRKSKRPFNFYEFHVRCGFKQYEHFDDLLQPSLHSKWKFLGYSEKNRSYLYTTKYKEEKPNFRELDEMQLCEYIGKCSIDFILDNSMCLNLKCEMTNNKLTYV